MIEMEEERLRMREHVMNEVCARSHWRSAAGDGDQLTGLFVSFTGGHKQRQTRLFRGVPGCYSEKGILGAWQLGGGERRPCWCSSRKGECCWIRLPQLLCSPLDTGAEPGLHGRGDEGVWGAPHSAGAGPEHEGRWPPETEGRAGETTGRAQCPEGWAPTGKRWKGLKAF